MRVADYIAETVKNYGVTDVFMLTGTGSIYLDDAFSHCEGLNYYCACHESSAAVMAEATAKLGKKIGVVISTTGPGAMNTLSGLVESWVDSVPLLVISGQVETKDIDLGVRAFGAQGFDIIKLAAQITKYSSTVTDANKIKYYVERAIHEATTGRPGPVWLDIPLDIQAAEICPEELEGFTVHQTEDQLEGTEFDDLIDGLMHATRPVIVVGGGAKFNEAPEKIRSLIRKLNVPVISSRLGQGIFTESMPLYYGLGGIRGRPEVGEIMRRADFVLSLGSSLSPTFTSKLFNFSDGSVKLWMVCNDQSEIDKDTIRLEGAFCQDVSRFLDEYQAALFNVKLPDWSGWIRECNSLKTAHEIKFSNLCSNPINSYFFLNELQKLTGGSHILVSDAGGCYYATGQVFKCDNGLVELTSGTFASMGVALPMSIGAAIAKREKQIIAIIGDGSIELNIQELKTLALYNLNVKIFVINNGGYASIRNSQDQNCGGRHTDTETVLNFEKIAEAFGIRYTSINDCEKVATSLKEILKRNQPELIEVYTDSQQAMIYN